MTAAQLARAIIEAELADNWFLADLLRPRWRVANRERRRLGLPPIAATQAWYFGKEQFR